MSMWRDRINAYSILLMIISMMVYIIYPQPLTLGLYCTFGIAFITLAILN
ncbi:MULTISPECIES: hypothetical protein [Peribacillus]|nr:hypothetical protein [Peribacillus simplex]